MEKTVADLKIGSKIILGAYPVSLDQTPAPITWLKADVANRCISDKVLDVLAFDAAEVRDVRRTAYGDQFVMEPNNNYALSNIHQYLNSQNVNWFTPTHPKDEPPELYPRHVQLRGTEYKDHPGFLNYFEGFEIAAMKEDRVVIGGEELTSLVRLPTLEEIKNDAMKFTLFRRKGVRAHPTPELVYGRRNAFLTESGFASFWTTDGSNGGSYVRYIDRGSYVSSSDPRYPNGVRPVIMLKPETKVRLIDKDTYELIPIECNDEPSKEDLLSFLGLALP